MGARNNFIRFLISLLLLPFASNLPAQDLRDPRFMEKVQAGFSDMFNQDYDRALQSFVALGKEYPHHPAPPLYVACVYWLEEMLRRQDLALNRFIAPTYFSGKTDLVMPPSERTEFFSNLQKSQDLANAILQRKRSDFDARYFLATCHGLRSSFAITIDHSLREAFTYANKAYSSTNKLIEEKPDYHDAYMTAGIYEYIVGSIPWYLKWMVFVIGVRGNKQDGLEHLRLASEKGQYVKNEARLVLMVLYVRERRYAEALEIARSLNERYPRSFLFPLNVAQILQMSGQKQQASSIFLQVEKRVEAREPNFDKIPLHVYRFNLGIDLMSMGQLDAAEDRFRKTISDPNTQQREKALSHLRLGQILDWKHKPNEAAIEYKTVLSLKNFNNSHDQAKSLLKKHK